MEVDSCGACRGRYKYESLGRKLQHIPTRIREDMQHPRAKMIAALLLILLFVGVSNGSSGYPTFPNNPNDEPVRMCGERLNEALDKMCSTSFNSIIKRDPTWLNLFGNAQEGSVFLRPRVLRNVAYRCCRNGPCRPSELLEYCSF